MTYVLIDKDGNECSNEADAVAKQVFDNEGKEIAWYVLCYKSRLYNPHNQYNIIRIQDKDKFKFISVQKITFLHYMRYLNMKYETDLRHAERSM